MATLTRKKRPPLASLQPPTNSVSTNNKIVNTQYLDLDDPRIKILEEKLNRLKVYNIDNLITLTKLFFYDKLNDAKINDGKNNYSKILILYEILIICQYNS